MLQFVYDHIGQFILVSAICINSNNQNKKNEHFATEHHCFSGQYVSHALRNN